METDNLDSDTQVLDRPVEIEFLLTSICTTVLKTDSIDINDRFLWLGGDSLTAIQIISEIKKTFSVSLPVTVVFKYDTIAKLAIYLKKEKLKQTQYAHIQTRDQKQFLLTDLQKNFYFIHQDQEKHAFVYNVPLILEINGSLDCNALSKSLNHLIERHDILRTIFYESSDGLIQEIIKDETKNIHLLIENVEREQLPGKIRLETKEHIPLDKLPLMRAKLFRLAKIKHVLVIVQPHIITDGWSLKIIKRELFKCYSAFVRKQSPNLLKIRTPYFEYIERRQQIIQNKHYLSDINYWKSKLEGIQKLNFPYDYARSGNSNFSGRRHPFFIKKELFKRINDFSAIHNVTPFILISATLNVLLSRYCYQEDIVFGFPISGRNEPGLEETVGLFINTLVLRTRVFSDKSFASLLQQVKENCLEAYTHQNVAFNELVNHLNVKRAFDINPIFQVMLVWQDWYEDVINPTSDITVRSKQVDQQTAKFDLTFELIPTESGLDGFIEFNTSLFRADTIERLSSHFVNLLEQCIIFSDAPLFKISLKCNPKEAAKILQKSPDIVKSTMIKMPRQLFEDQAKRTPSQVALVNQERYLNYAALNQQANQLARYIQSKYQSLAKKTRTETPVIGIFLNKSINTIISMLAVLKMGAAYVPIDTRNPEERIKFIISDANCVLIITESIHKETLNFADQSLILLDQEEGEIARYSVDNLSIINKPDALIYIIYTSGTTGKPKGVMQTHFNVARLFYVTNRIFHFGKADTWLFFHSHAFDFSVWEIWGALLYGGQLVIPTEDDIIDPSRIYQLIIQHKVTVLNQTPSAFQGLLQECKTHPSDELPLRHVIFGGEALDIKMLSDWWAHYSNTHPVMVNMYGITETTVHTTYKILSKADLNRRETSNIGVPLDDMKIFIVDQNMQPVPIGIPGELLIGGNGLATGYLNHPEMTREKFIINYFDNEHNDDNHFPQRNEGNRFYRTGDLVRYLADGSLEYLGRIDKQIKFKGFRIETEEIESALRRFPKIIQCAVITKKCHDTAKLVAYYTLKKQEKEDLKPQHLQPFLSKLLPSYMIPNLFIRIESIPLTDNMKTDYAALPSIEHSFVGIKSKFQKPMTIYQKTLALIWEKTLHLKNVGLDDNFFGIGGDSITSLKVTAEAREKGFSLSVSDIFKYQTIRDLVTFCWNKHKITPTSVQLTSFSLLQENDINLLPNDSVDAYPMSSLQLGMIYHSNYAPDSAVYLDIFRYKINVIYENDCFMGSLQQLVNAHPILRTTFHLNTYSIPVQIVHKSISPSVTIKDLSKLDKIDQEKALKEWMEQQKKHPFDFEKGPLFRITIHRLSDTVSDIGLSFHHAILDGWSVATFITTLLSNYSDLLNGRRVSVDVNKHYREFIQLEKIAVSSEIHERFWKNNLSDFEYIDIPKWHGDQCNDDKFVTHPVIFSKELTTRLITLSKDLNVSMDIILLTVLIKLLSILTNSEEVLTGVVFNGRPSVTHIENTLGLFLNALPFRQRLIEGSWKDLILAISNKKSKIYPHRHYPLMQIQKDLQVNKLFNVLFYFTHFHVYEHIRNSKHVEIIEQSFYERTNFPLTFNCSVDPLQNKLKLTINYETKHYEHEQIRKFSAYFSDILSSILHDSNANHRKFKALTLKEKQLILVDWNKTDINYNLNQPIHCLIEEQARKTPNHIAVRCNDIELDYQSLDARANFLAHFLKSRGACTGDYIVIYTQRSVESIAAILAILKLGCVYVPIDVMQSEERVEYILKELNCKFIFTNRSVIESLNITANIKSKLLIIDDIFEKNKSNENADFSSYQFKKEDVAYVIYTSGSTGNPKGVMIRHVSLLNFLFYMKEKISINENDRLLALASFSFDISLLEIFLPLLTGATCVLADYEQNRDPRWIVNAIRQYEITCLQATPTIWKMLFDFGYQLDPSIKALSTGEPLTRPVASHLIKSHFAWNLYGPTETTIWSTCYRLREGKNNFSPVSIGKPIANTKIYVLGRNLKPVPIGVSGELYIAGLGVAKGYLHKESLSKERFIRNPFDISSGAYTKMYKTGDLARWLPNGSLYFMGRTDHQFKLRGFRIESGDIESALLQHKSIKECVALVRKIKDIDYLIAYIVLHPSDEITAPKKLRVFLLKKLPYYMFPDKFIFLDSIPTNINGKTDLKALLSLDVEQTQLLTVKENALLTDEQKALSYIWHQILNIKSLSPKDNFYDLGGNSILSLIAIQKINDRFSVDLSIRSFIEHPVLSELAEEISNYKKKNKQNNVQSKTFSFIKKIPNPIVTLKSEGRNKPLFLIHPVGGTVFYYIPLVKRLQSDRPIYAIQDPGIEAKDKLFSSLSEMVEFYIDVIKEYQRNGPYYIAGSSFGANASVEMARQLIDRNDQVSFTGLMDGWAKYPEKANNDRKWFENNLKIQMKEMNVLLPEFSTTEIFLDLHWHRQQLLAQYDLQEKLKMDITLFKAQDTMEVLKPLDSPHNNWERYCSVIPKTYIVPGNHFTMHFEPHVDKLAKVFDICLKDSDKK